MNLQQLLASLLNPNGTQQAMPIRQMAPSQVGDGNNPSLLMQAQQRLAQPPQQAFAMQAPQAQPMQQGAPQAAPMASGGLLGGGGIGGLLGNIFNPNGGSEARVAQTLQQWGTDPGVAAIATKDPSILRALVQQRMQGSDPLDQEYKRAQIENLKSEAAARSNPNARDKFGNNPVWGKDPKTGKWVLFQLNNSGGLAAAPAPDGIDLIPPGIGQVDLGTSYGIRDRAGDIIGNVPIDNAGKASDTQYGKGQGDARVSYNSVLSKMPGLETVVTQLDDLANKATYTTAGQLYNAGRKELGLSPSEGAIARTQYISQVSNQILPLLRDTFGAQFTAREGDTLMATMGDPDKTPAEKQAVLKSFIEQKRRDIESLARQTGQGAPAAGTSAPTFGSNTEVFDAIQAGKLKVGDEIIVNGKRMRVDP